MSIWNWSEWLTPVPAAARLTLGEGHTPLVRSRRIGPSLGLSELYFKLELTNPTGSYKDRFASVAVSDMLARGKTTCWATSSGNTGAALAAYCAVGGLRCCIVIVEKAPVGKLRQMLAYGAHLVRIRGFGIDSDVSNRVIARLEELSRQPAADLQISAFKFSPAGMSGVLTLAHELHAQSPAPWDHVFCMAGGGGLVLAVARGFEQLLEAGKLSALPRVECVQPEGNNTISGPLRAGRDRGQTVECTTKISGLQVPNIVDAEAVIAAARRHGGTGHLVSDALVWELQKRLAREEGIFAEPAGATAVAGLVHAVQRGEIPATARVCCLVTGSAFKDPEALEALTRDAECPLLDFAEWNDRVSQSP
jgi:threonine synthase